MVEHFSQSVHATCRLRNISKLSFNLMYLKRALKIQLNPDNSNLQGEQKNVRVIGRFELLRVKLVRK